MPTISMPSVRVVRGGDAGDSYNYAPRPAEDLVDTPIEERLEVVERGPVREVVVLERTYRWDGHAVVTQTRYEQRAHERLVRIEFSFDNPCDDQRVRLHVRLRQDTDRSFAEGQFAVAERLSAPEGGYGEEPTATYPASAFVSAGGVTLFLEHVSEYELVARGELALTALRSIGLISRASNRWREDPAGPELPIPAAQLRGPRRFAFAWSRLPIEEAPSAAESYRLPFVSAVGRSPTGDLAERQGPCVTNATLTSLRRRGDALEARVVNTSGSTAIADIGETRIELAPWQIASVRVPEAEAAAATCVGDARTPGARIRSGSR
jgi:alpha-mannosidase